MNAPVLDIRDAVKTFTSNRSLFGAPTIVRAVDGVTLAIEDGETFAIVGESGSGKSTLARMLVRLIDPTSGEIRYRGSDIATLSPARMREMRGDLQFIFQDPFSSLNPRMSVGRIVGEPLETHTDLGATERRAKVAALLARVGLRPEHAERYPHEFSGGQRQRIGIARALASGPSVLIGDEPVSALDLSIQAQVINLLQDLKAEFGLTLVIIAHDLAVIRHMSDRVAVMYLGRIVELASADALFAEPLHPYTQALLAAIPEARRGERAPRHVLSGEMPNPAAPPPGCRFHTRCPFADDRCVAESPPLAETGEGRKVACHHWKAISASGAAYRPPVPPEMRPATARRFALYRDAARLRQPENERKPAEEKTDANT